MAPVLPPMSSSGMTRRRSPAFDVEPTVTTAQPGSRIWCPSWILAHEGDRSYPVVPEPISPI